MKQLGINFVRLPLGYWNVIDMQGAPNARDAQAKERMSHLAEIMPAAGYKKYIDQIIGYAR